MSPSTGTAWQTDVDPDGRADILIVDDRPENLLALEAVLEPLGQNLVRAQSGEEALKHLLHHNVAVILLDVQMPGLDGFETAAHIKERERTRHIPIIFLTAISGEAHHAARGYSAGAVDYITKPFDPWVLRAKVAVFVELHQKNELLKTQAEQLRHELAQRHEAERALADKAAELERSNAELEQFAAVASHDLSSPLNTVAGLLRMLVLDHGDDLGESGRDLLERAQRSLGGMRQLIDDLLSYSRAGSVFLSRGDVDCAELVVDVLERVDSLADRTGAMVMVDPLPVVHGDRILLGELFQNLITNAMKFTAPDTTPRIRVSVERGPRVWRFAVSDNGIGIPSDHRRDVFEMFRRLHGSDAYPGTGIGLATCARIVERHGGDIWIDAAPGGGTIVHFTVPDREDG